MTAAQTTLAFDGSRIDGALFTTVTDFARDTKWLNTPLMLWTNAGLGVFAVLMLIGWWNARRKDSVTMTLALATPVAVMVAFAVAEVVKKMVGELRPCHSMPQDYFVDSCPAPSDYAFPSGHTTVAAATVAALWLLDRRLSAIAALFAVFEAFTRVYVGAHYPHDVLGSAILALPVGLLISWLLGRFAPPLVARLRTGALKPLLTAEPAGAHAAR
ncbi:phosphatase PAP2 family protein [Kitasatospora sp. RB6PN24]|uniref:phosphatase PAP2 family protein n=1 Tax=Kitasatospora humi TaxID=2893891 RepID=UPI001E2FE633|nr:phosphatase PAP2 family protein [Kitasatospora humi]MCC9311011.1 phosphatase PAP2 family protein [Kitasatospora humi]